MNRIGNFITSVRAVMIVMFLIIIALIFDSQTLFIRTLPVDMDAWAKEVTSWVMAIGFEFTVLLTTANSNFINKRINVMLAISTFLMTLFFFDVFQYTEKIEVFRVVFVSALIAYINYIYAELFVKKWQEHKSSIKNQNEILVKVGELTKALFESKEDALKLQLTVTQTSDKLIEVEQKLNNAQLEISEYENNVSILNERIRILQTENSEYKRKLTRRRI